MALVCKEVNGILIFGPSWMPSSMLSFSKCTQVFPLTRKEFTENNLLSRFGTISTSSRINVPMPKIYLKR